MSRSSTGNTEFLPIKAIILLAACYALIRILFWFTAETGGDEAYYWVWGQRPELSYFDHPAMLAWVQGLFATLFGQSIAVLRLPNLLTTGIIFYVYYLITQRLYPDRYRALFIPVALTLAASPMLFTFMAQAIMDHIMIALLLAASYLVIFYLDDATSGRPTTVWRLYAGAVLLGLAGITKYNAVFLGLGIALTVLLHPRLRPLLKQPHIYLAGLLSLAMLSPTLIWNFEHDFISFRYQLLDRTPSAAGMQLHPEIFAGFVVGTILVLSPFTVWMAVRKFFIGNSTRPSGWFRPGNYSIYGTVALITFVLSTAVFLSRSLFTNTLLYWNIPAYLLLLPLVASVLVDGEGRLVRRKLFIGQQVYGVLMAGLVAFNFAVLPLDSWSRQGPGDRGTRHWYGWEDTADAIREEIAKTGKPLLLFTTDHHVAGGLSFAMNRTDIVAVSRRRDQYDIWWDDSQYAGRDGLIIFDEWGTDRTLALSLFQRAGPAREVKIRKYGYPVKIMYLQPVYEYRGGKRPG